VKPKPSRDIVFKRLATVSIIGALIAAPLADAQARCLNARERNAVNVRIMQTELMVAALSCRGVPGRDFTNQYNVFVRKHGNGLVGNARILQAYFKARYGAEGQRQLDAFITELANETSRRSMNSPTFCDESVALFQEAMGIDRRELETWSARRTAKQAVAIESCEAELQGRDAASR
jgi:hypothetical protein